MSEIPIRALDCKTEVPVTLYNERKAAVAYERYRALRVAQSISPGLIDEECFQILLDDAWRSFMTAFVGGE